MVISYSNFYSKHQNLKIIALKEFVDRGEQIIFLPHKIDFYSFVFVVDGELDLIVDNNNLKINKNAALFVGPGQLVQFSSPIDADAYVISFTEDFLFKDLKDSVISHHFKMLLDFCDLNILKIDDNYFSYLKNFLEILYIESRNTSDIFQAPILQHTLSSIFYLLARFNESVEVKVNAVKKNKYYNLALDFKILLHESINNHATIHYYLDKLNVSQSTLQLATKIIYKKTPKVLIDEALIVYAKRLLADSCKRVREVGYELGFSEPTNFTKFFKKHTGFTPESFRNQYFKF